MASSSGADKPLYPKVDEAHPDANSPFVSAAGSSTGAYPTIDMSNLAAALYPESNADADAADAPPSPEPLEETLITIPGAMLHLIDPDESVPLAAGVFTVFRLRQGDHTVAIIARVSPSPADEASGAEPVQWPVMKDVAAVRLEHAHYFFSLHVPHGESTGDGAEDHGGEERPGDSSDVVSYGLTFAAKGQDKKLKELDKFLDKYTTFSIQKVAPKKEKKEKAVEVVEIVEVVEAAKTVTPEEAMGNKKAIVEERSALYWTTIAPNVDEYSSTVARLIAGGSGQLIRGIIWTGDFTSDRVRGAAAAVKSRSAPGAKPKPIKPGTIRRMRRARRITAMSDNVANAILSGVLKVTGFFTSSFLNSPIGQKFSKLMPGEVILASLDGFVKICDAAEEAGKNVLTTSSVVTTEIATHKYGDQAGELTQEYLSATGHALGTAWAVFKIRKALDPKKGMKSKTLANYAAKNAADDLRAHHVTDDKSKHKKK